MASTKLVRKALRNRAVSRKRVNAIKRLTTKPVIKNVDIEQIKEEFAKKKVAPTAKKEAPVKEEPKAESKEVKKEAPKAEETPKAESAEKAPEATEKKKAPVKKAAPKAEKKEDKAE